MGKTYVSFLFYEWMSTELKLKGQDLFVFMVIYGYSKDGVGVFYGSRSFLARLCQSTSRAISRNLNSLLAKDYIRKESETVNGVKRCKYWVNPRIVAKYRDLDFNGNPDLL